MGNKKTDTYDVIYSSIRRIPKLRTSKGEIRFTATMKLIYAYIWTFQENKGRGNNDPIHTNTNVIAWEMGVSEKTVIDALKALDDAKVVIKRTEKVRGNVNSSNYVAIPPASVVALGITPPHPNESKSKPKKKKVAASANEENKGDDESDQGDAEHRDGVPDIHSDQHDDVSANDAVNGEEHSRQCETPPVLAVNGAESEQWETPQRADIFDLKLWREEGPSGFGFMEYGKEHGETEVEKIAALIDQHYTDAIKIFDENYVVTEEFINSLSGDAAPNRNTDGTLQSFRYVYWVARYSQDERDGIPVRKREEYMAEAKPEYIPAHLMPKSEPVQDFSNETIPY